MSNEKKSTPKPPPFKSKWQKAETTEDKPSVNDDDVVYNETDAIDSFLATASDIANNIEDDSDVFDYKTQSQNEDLKTDAPSLPITDENNQSDLSLQTEYKNEEEEEEIEFSVDDNDSVIASNIFDSPETYEETEDDIPLPPEDGTPNLQEIFTKEEDEEAEVKIDTEEEKQVTSTETTQDLDVSEFEPEHDDYKMIVDTNDISKPLEASEIVTDDENLYTEPKIEATFSKEYIGIEEELAETKKTEQPMDDAFLQSETMNIEEEALDETIDTQDEPEISVIEIPKQPEIKYSSPSDYYTSSSFKYEDCEELEGGNYQSSGTNKTPITPEFEAKGSEPATAQSTSHSTLPIKNKSSLTPKNSIEIKAGDGYKSFFASKGGEIILNIDTPKQEWRLFINKMDKKDISVDAGETFQIPSDTDFAAGILYATKDTFLKVTEEETYTFSENDDNWKLFLSSLKEIPISGDDTINLDGENGLLIGPKSTSLFFYNAGTIKINRKKIGNYEAPNYNPQDLMVEESKNKSYLFSSYHENAFFEADDEVNSICLECEDNNTYGWNVKFENGLFMSIADIIEFQNRNKALPDNSGILYRGASRLEFTGVKTIKVYKKPFYYGYGLQS